MSGTGMTICKTDAGSSRCVNIDKKDNVRKLISEKFPATRWKTKFFTGGTAEFGYCNSGDGGIVFGLFHLEGDELKNLDLEIRGRISDGNFEPVSEFCDRDGWEIPSDEWFEEQINAPYPMKLEKAVGDASGRALTGAFRDTATCGSAGRRGSNIMTAMKKAKRKSTVRR